MKKIIVLSVKDVMLNLITNIHVYAVHEGTEKPFKCDNRDATFDYPQNIDRHVTGVHEGKKQLKCDYRFTQKLSWKSHIT